MADQRHIRPPDDLERSLHDLGRQLDWPRESDLLPGVRQRIGNSTPRRSPFARNWFALSSSRLGWATAALILLAALVVALSDSTRSTVADRLGLTGVSISTDPTATLTPGRALKLGEDVTLDDAIVRAGDGLVMPPVDSLGAPDTIYVLDLDSVTQVTYVYDPRADLPEAGESGVGLLISQFDGSTNESFIQKQLGPATSIEMVDVSGRPAFWLTGEPHVFYYESPDGTIHEETIRLAANVLLWEQSGKTIRIESSLDRDTAVRIAESMNAVR